YGYSYASSEAGRDRELQLMAKVAEEKAYGIEYSIVRDDQKLFGSNLPLDAFIDKLRDLANGVHVMSVFVLDERLDIIPGGYVSLRGDKDGIAFRDWFREEVLPDLPLAQQPVNERGHVHEYWSGWPRAGDRKDFLFSF